MTGNGPLGGYEPSDPFEAGVAAALTRGTAAAARDRADRHFTEASRLRSAFRVVGGAQTGLSGRWRLGMATVSPGRLEFRRRWSWAFRTPPLTVPVHAVHGPVRQPASNEVMKLPGPVIQIQTATGFLEWALPTRYRAAAVARLRVGFPDDDEAGL
jgi:hypothetical protein